VELRITAGIITEIQGKKAIAGWTSDKLLKGAGAGADPSEVNDIADVLTTQGDIIKRGAAAPERLAKGTQNFFLRMGANEPEWVRGFEWGINPALWYWEKAFHNWTTTLSGSASVLRKNYVEINLRTGTTANSEAKGIGYSFGWVDFSSLDLEWLLFVYGLGVHTATGKSWWKVDIDAYGDPTDKAFGFRADDQALKGIVHDGTSLTEVDLASSITDVHKLVLKFTPGDKVEWFVDGASKGSSAAIPSGVRGADMYTMVAVNNGANAADQEVRCHLSGTIQW